MAFPQVAATSKNSTAAGATHAITLPSGIVAGNLLLIFFATDGDNTVTNWGGFTEIFSTSNGTAASLHVGWKIAVGSDTCTLTVSVTNEIASHVCYRVTGHDSGQAPEASTGVTTASQYPAPDSLTPTGGAKDYLWIGVEGHDHTDVVTAYPTDLTDNRDYQSEGSNGGCGVGVASLENNVSVYDPSGTFTLTGTEQWISCTVAVHPLSVQDTELVVPDTVHTLAADGIALTQAHTLVLGDTAHLLAADAIAVTQVHTLVVPDTVHTLDADSIALTEHKTLAVPDTVHTVDADGIALTQAHTLVAPDTVHTLDADAIALTQVHGLTVPDTVHTLSADSIAVTQAHTLVVPDTVHTLTADAITVTESNLLVVPDTVHAHAVDSPVLTQVHNLTVPDTAHTVDADSIAVTQAHTLVVPDTVHTLDADAIALVQQYNLVVQDAVHALSADEIALTQAHTLAVSDIAHAHTIDGDLVLVEDGGGGGQKQRGQFTQGLGMEL